MTWRDVLGTTGRGGPPAPRRSTRPLRDCLRQRRLLDLLRARPGGGTRTRPDAARLPLGGRAVRAGREDLFGGGLAVPGGRRLAVVRTPRFQRGRFVLRGLGA